MNLILDTDSYKASHFLQYPPGTTHEFSYVESRGGKYATTVFFGLQYIIKKYLMSPITASDVLEANEFFKLHGEPFNLDGWMHIVHDHNGFIPLRIRAVPEGSVVPVHNVLMTVENTCPKCYWTTSYFETLLMRVWYPTTVATRSYHAKKVIMDALSRSCDDPQGQILFKLHDFGSRGVSSQESAALGGAAHLVNFMGSDTVAGVYLANKYYDEKMAGFSIPAAEHSTITAWGKDGEAKAYANMLKQFAKPGSIVAVVSDSYDIYNAAEKIWGEELRQQVIDSGATVVIRPDSGHPPTVVGDLLEILDKKFGSVVNKKGYKVLNHVRIIQGDGVNEDSIKECLDKCLSLGFSAENLAFGMGGGLLQQLNRDTQKFAYKCSGIRINNGNFIPVQKAPVGDLTKWSKAGHLDLVKVNGKYATVNEQRWDSVMRLVYFEGQAVEDQTFAEIRARAQ